jgi:hypothetical protein
MTTFTGVLLLALVLLLLAGPSDSFTGVGFKNGWLGQSTAVYEPIHQYYPLLQGSVSRDFISTYLGATTNADAESKTGGVLVLPASILSRDLLISFTRQWAKGQAAEEYSIVQYKVRPKYLFYYSTLHTKFTLALSLSMSDRSEKRRKSADSASSFLVCWSTILARCISAGFVMSYAEVSELGANLSSASSSSRLRLKLADKRGRLFMFGGSGAAIINQLAL